MEWALFIFITIYGIYGTASIKQAKAIKARKAIDASHIAVEEKFNALVIRNALIDDMPPGYDKFKAKEMLIKEVETLLLENPTLHRAQSSNIIQLRQLVR
jgi:hypothetical protein